MNVPQFATLLSVLVLTSTCTIAEQPWIIDPHTHFKGRDQIALESKMVNREPQYTLGHVVDPEEYRGLADRLGIQSTLVVEAVDQDRPQFND